MKVKIEQWTVKEFFDLSEQINEQPRYQRGGVWKDSKRSLLIDSMLRGFDLPKIFLNKRERGAYQYEVADGQQRINSILKFRGDKLALRDDDILGLDLNKIGRYKVGGKYFSELHTDLQKTFDKYKLTIAVVENATSEEIRTLFGRLQLGEALTPAEKRNAIVSKIGNDINTIALTHEFFKNSKIKKERFNHQDYLAHACTLIAYDNKNDLKAKLIEQMYLDGRLSWSMAKMQKIDRILDFMSGVNSQSRKKIEKKFAFLDIFWFLYKELGSFDNIDIVGFADHYDKFESDRKRNHKKPEVLLKGRNKNVDLYDYIMAFRFEGLRAINYDKRNKIINKEFKKFLL